MTIGEPDGELQLEHPNERPERPQAPGDGAIVAVVALVAGSVTTWAGALTLTLIHLANGTDPALGLGVAVLAATITLISVHMGLDLSRRRRLRRALDAVRADVQHSAVEARAETMKKLETTNRLLAAVMERVDQARIEITVQREVIEEMRQKVSAQDWNAWAAQLPGHATVVDIHRNGHHSG